MTWRAHFQPIGGTHRGDDYIGIRQGESPLLRNDCCEIEKWVKTHFGLSDDASTGRYVMLFIGQYVNIG